MKKLGDSGGADERQGWGWGVDQLTVYLNIIPNDKIRNDVNIKPRTLVYVNICFSFYYRYFFINTILCNIFS